MALYSRACSCYKIVKELLFFERKDDLNYIKDNFVLNLIT
jgi:hypothetical protein